MAKEVNCLHCKHSLIKGKKCWGTRVITSEIRELICPQCGKQYIAEVRYSVSYFLMTLVVFLPLGLFLPKELPFRVFIHVLLAVIITDVICYVFTIQLLDTPFFRNAFSIKEKVETSIQE